MSTSSTGSRPTGGTAVTIHHQEAEAGKVPAAASPRRMSIEQATPARFAAAGSGDVPAPAKSLEDRSVRQSVSFGTLLKVLFLAAMPVLSLSRENPPGLSAPKQGPVFHEVDEPAPLLVHVNPSVRTAPKPHLAAVATQGLFDDLVALLGNEMGVGMFMLLQAENDPANLAAVNAALKGLVVEGHNTNLWVSAGAPKNANAYGNWVAKLRRNAQAEVLKELITLNAPQAGVDPEGAFQIFLADKSVRPGVFISGKESAWTWDRVEASPYSVAVIESVGEPAWSKTKAPHPYDVTTAGMLAEGKPRVLAFTNLGAGGEQDNAIRYYTAQGCTVLTIPLLDGTNLTVVAPANTREKLADFASEHRDEGVHLHEPEPSSAWGTALVAGAVMGGAGIAAWLARTAPATGTRQDDPPSGAQVSGRRERRKTGQAMRTAPGKTGGDGSGLAASMPPGSATPGASAGPAPIQYDLNQVVERVKRAFDGKDEDGKRLAARQLGVDLMVAMEDPDPDRVAEAAGIIVGVIRAARGKTALLQDYLQGMQSEYDLDSVLQKAEATVKHSGGSDQLNGAIKQLRNIRRVLDRLSTGSSDSGYAAEGKAGDSAESSVDENPAGDVAPPEPATPAAEPKTTRESTHSLKTIATEVRALAPPTAVNPGKNSGEFWVGPFTSLHLHFTRNSVTYAGARGHRYIMSGNAVNPVHLRSTIEDVAGQVQSNPSLRAVLDALHHIDRLSRDDETKG